MFRYDCDDASSAKKTGSLTAEVSRYFLARVKAMKKKKDIIHTAGLHCDQSDAESYIHVGFLSCVHELL